MRLSPRRQASTIEVRNWVRDAQFPVFPVGARAKEALWSPANVPAGVRPSWRYLFKRSKRSYPDQFWGEVIAYRIGCLLGVEVPAAFVAYNSQTDVCGALIEWFYSSPDSFLHGGDYLVRLQPDYDRDVGTQHNMHDVQVLMQALRKNQIAIFETDWRQWWVDALLFDALIGNTDRHQDNWGVIVGQPAFVHPPRRLIRMAPLFDNGTSLGHERFTGRIAGWGEAEYDRYLKKGSHHVKWSLQEPIAGHLDLLKRAMLAWPATVTLARDRLKFAKMS